MVKTFEEEEESDEEFHIEREDNEYEDLEEAIVEMKQLLKA